MIRRWRGAPPPGLLRIRPDGVRAALLAADCSHPNETGGILLGWRSTDAVVVTGSLEVPDIGASPHRYRRHHGAAQAALTAALADEPADGPVGYVGEWHVHPAHQPASWQDRREIIAISGLAPAAVTLVILAGQPGGWQLHAVNGCAGRVATASILQEELP